MVAMQWGIIGPGTISHKFVKDLGLVNPPQLVKALLGHTEEKTKEFARQYYIPHVFTSLDEFINQGRPEIVYIATPHPMHYKQALACLENKIPVLCEKPLTLNAEQCKRLVKASRRNRTFLMEGMWIRFLPTLRQVIELINQGLIGKVISVKGSISFEAPVGDNRFFKPELGGGSLLDLGIYPVFLATLLLGKPTSVKAKGILTGQGVDKSCNIFMEYGEGSYAALESSFTKQSALPAVITGESGVIRILHPWYEKAKGIELLLNNKGTKIIYPCYWEGHGLQFEAAEAVKCIVRKRIASDLLPHELTLATMEAMDEIRRQVHVAYEIYE